MHTSFLANLIGLRTALAIPIAQNPSQSSVSSIASSSPYISNSPSSAVSPLSPLSAIQSASTTSRAYTPSAQASSLASPSSTNFIPISTQNMIASNVSTVPSPTATIKVTTQTILGTLVNTQFTTKTSELLAATSIPSLDPPVDKNFNQTASGLVTILYLNSQANSPSGLYTSSAAMAFTNTTENNNNNLIIDSRVFPEGENYREYVSQVKDSCTKKTKGLFDILVVESTAIGELRDCFLDLNTWDSTIGAGFDSVALKNGIYKGRLLTLPTEITYGVLYYNKDLLEYSDIYHLPQTIDDMENMMYSVVQKSRMYDNFKVFGYTSLFSGEELTAQTSEWSQGMNKTSNIIDPTSGNITVQSPGVRQGFEKLSAWVDNNLIDANDLSAISVDSYGPPNQYDNSIEKFAKGNAVFMRHWSTVAATLKSRNLPFRWGILPVLGHTSGMNVGALGGWNVGVYRFANNPSGAVKVVKWMTSRQSQRDMVVNGNIPVFSARADLYRDGNYCSVSGTDLCTIFATITPSLRPSTITGSLYRKVSQTISSNTLEYLATVEGIATALNRIQSQLAIVLSQNVTGTIGGGEERVKKSPSYLEHQLTGLTIITIVTVSVIVFFKKHKRPVVNNGASSTTTTTGTKGSGATAASSLISKSKEIKEDVNNGVNEFQILDEAEEEEDDENETDDDSDYDHDEEKGRGSSARLNDYDMSTSKQDKKGLFSKQNSKNLIKKSERADFI